MTLSNTLRKASNMQEFERKLHTCVSDLFPICRSITGQGVRDTLALLAQIEPINIREVPTGTPVLDWQVPNEWNINDAYIKNSAGERVVDFKQSTLHVLNYSVPFSGKLSLEQLKPHLYTLPEQADLIPYRTSYYKENWGFCLTQNTLDAMPEDQYDVHIDASLAPGFLTYGEIFIAGKTSQEVLVSCHICHPSLANDNLSGVAVAIYLAQLLRTQSLAKSLHYSYRLVFVPGTIGAITWLAENDSAIKNIKHGLVLAGVGDAGKLTYKKSRQESSEIDNIVAYVLKQQGEHEILSFSPYGYDERQYCSPGFNLPVGRLSRTPHGSFPEYHTSADNLDFVKPQQLAKSLLACCETVDVLENNNTYLNLKPFAEPCLSKYGLYGDIGGLTACANTQMALLWVLNQSDGNTSLLDIAIKSDLAFNDICAAATALQKCALLKQVDK